MFRNLKKSEIEVRVQSLKSGKALVLLYKDARCDMNILDEMVGHLYWRREHSIIGNRFCCTVSLFDKDFKQWVSKTDVGTESNTEKEKGQASDSFKRACFNWGIGRELYTSPIIRIEVSSNETYEFKGKQKLNAWIKFHVSYIKIENGKITEIELKDNNNNVRWSNIVTFKQKILNLTENKPENNKIVGSLLNGKKADEIPVDEQEKFLSVIAKTLSANN